MAKFSYQLLDVNNPVFASFAVWASILILKTLFMSLLTAFYRFKNKVFANPEDLQSPKLKVRFNDDDVERVRRGHRNDLENILPYLIAGLLYVLSNPSVFLATTLFKVAAISRIAHTIVYTVFVIPQPARAVAWFIHYAITIYITGSALWYFLL